MDLLLFGISSEDSTYLNIYGGMCFYVKVNFIIKRSVLKEKLSQVIIYSHEIK